jgi:hypothetical protein
MLKNHAPKLVADTTPLQVSQRRVIKRGLGGSKARHEGRDIGRVIGAVFDPIDQKSCIHEQSVDSAGSPTIAELPLVTAGGREFLVRHGQEFQRCGEIAVIAKIDLMAVQSARCRDAGHHARNTRQIGNVFQKCIGVDDVNRGDWYAAKRLGRLLDAGDNIAIASIRITRSIAGPSHLARNAL